jgi:hypothetical protein
METWGDIIKYVIDNCIEYDYNKADGMLIITDTKLDSDTIAEIYSWDGLRIEAQGHEDEIQVDPEGEGIYINPIFWRDENATDL